MERARFWFYRSRHLLCICTGFLQCDVSAKTTICGFTECRMHCCDSPQNITSDQGTHCTPKELSLELTDLLFPTTLA